MILHLTPRADWDAAPADQPYRPSSLDAEGFVHATQGDALLLHVANRFYKDQPGEFIVLEIDESKLTSEVRWEPAAQPSGPVEALPASPSEVLPPEAQAEFGELAGGFASEPAQAQRFPHIYGPINREAIVGLRRMVRAADGTFTGYAALSDPHNPLGLKTPSQMAEELLAATDEFSEALKRFKDMTEGRMAELDEKIKRL